MDFGFAILDLRLNPPRRMRGCSTRSPAHWLTGSLGNPKSQIPNPKSAFTLTELLVVVSIIIVVSLMTIPAMTPFFRGQRLRSGARILQSAVVQARSVAIAHRAIYQLVFIAAENYMILRHDESRYPNGESQFSKNIELPDRVQFVTTAGFLQIQDRITYVPSGGTTGIASLTTDQRTIQIRDQSGTGMGLTIQPTTGTVRRSP